MDDVSRAIGLLEGKMDRSIDMLKGIEEHMDALEKRLSKTEALAQSTHKTITDDVKPVIETVKRYENRGMGMLVAFGFVVSVATGALMLVKDRVLNMLFGA